MLEFARGFKWLIKASLVVVVSLAVACVSGPTAPVASNGTAPAGIRIQGTFTGGTVLGGNIAVLSAKATASQPLESEWFATASDRDNGVNRLATGEVFGIVADVAPGGTFAVYLRVRAVGETIWQKRMFFYERAYDGSWPPSGTVWVN